MTSVGAGLDSHVPGPGESKSVEAASPEDAETRPYGSGASPEQDSHPYGTRLPVFEILMVYVLILGAYFRLTPYTEKGNPKLQWGILWGEGQWLHPDERFLLFVSGDISPMKDVPVDPSNPNGPQKRGWLTLSDYFNTAKSNLNPNNHGYSFFVYGTLPIFMTRYLTEIIFNHRVGWNEIASVGRPLSALSDWLVILLVFLAASRLFNKRVGLLAAVFYSWAVLPIQLSHFYKEDTFTNFFTFLAIYFAILIATSAWHKLRPGKAAPPPQAASWSGEAGEPLTAGDRLTAGGSTSGGIPRAAVSAAGPILEWLHQPMLWYSVGFGFALGCAVASKVLAVPVAVMLPIAFAVRLFTLPAEERDQRWTEALLFVVLGALVSLFTFRVFQPYAFKGPSFFNVGINKAWLDGILAQRAQTDFPPAMQWARRPFTFALKNLTAWGLGLPLGLLAWAGFLWAGWRMLKGDWQRVVLPWIWTLGYFAFQMWQSHFNPSMRYFLPMYPTLVIFAAWILVWVYDRIRAAAFWRIAAVVVGAFVLIYTLLYAYGFSRLYTRPITRLAASRWIYQNIPGPIDLHFDTPSGVVNQPMPVPYDYTISKVTPYDAAFEAKQEGTLTQVSLNNLAVLNSLAGGSRVSIAIRGPEDISTTASIVLDAQPGSAPANFTLTFDPPLPVTKGVMYAVNLEVEQDGVVFSLAGDMVANEGDWDDGIPYPIDGYNAFGGIFPLRVDSLADFYTKQGLSITDVNTLSTPNFNMYWEENNADKYQRFIRILDSTDYIFITSNRQWGSLTRIPERFPMTTLYYRNLLGCPLDQDIVDCYSVAKPGTYQGNLGFELVATFTSEPSVGPFKLNDQFAEEAFTVYDHPKVLIFRKTPAYDSQKVAALLGSIDWTKTIHVYPDKAGSYPADLMLPAGRLQQQQSGGTWSELFNPQALFNRIQVLGVALWYVCIFLLGVLTYPLVRLALHGLPDRGYPLARTAGLLLLSWLVWIAGSSGIPFTRLTITIALLLMAIAGVVLGYFQRAELAAEWRTRRKYFIMIEIVALCFFLFDLFIRYGNPDLWHPWMGGEKPMDFSYFNAVLKSTTFPPYDPWFAGGYLNYYYYGFVFVGVMVKWLGIVPSFAYNLILPTLFSMTALGAFSVAYNIYSKWESGRENKDHESDQTEERRLIHQTEERRLIQRNNAKGAIEEDVGGWEGEGGSIGAQTGDLGTAHAPGRASLSPDPLSPAFSSPMEDARNPRPQRSFPAWHISMPVKVGLMAGILMVALGNLGTVGMIEIGLERLGGGGGRAPITTRIGWIVQGTIKAVKGQQLPYAINQWYWNPSRIIPELGNEITEFPFFTFLYADPHAHMMVMPVALLALAWAVSLVLGPWGKKRPPSEPSASDPLSPDPLSPEGRRDQGGRGERILSLVSIALSFFLGGLASGAIYPMNLSDRYTYLALGVVAVAYSFWRFMDVDGLQFLSGVPKISRRLLVTALGVIGFVALNILLFKPYSDWYGQAYGAVQWWRGDRTPIWAYLTHWGLFLFIMVSWLFWETRDWMAHTPLSAVRKLAPYVMWIYAALAVLVLLMIAQQAFVLGLISSLKVYAPWKQVSVVWLIVPLAAWAAVLLLRPDQPEAKRVVLFLFGTGLAITLLVENVVVVGDIGRMNTVFKFYLQVWALFAVCSAAALGWLWSDIRAWLPSWRIPWTIILAALVVGAGMYTFFAGRAKIEDRMTTTAPHTLDGMTYMRYTTTYDQPNGSNPSFQIDPSRDYYAIRWAQDNIKGSPVIVEGNNGDQYRWMPRFTIYTGLPGILGYPGHQSQQRALLPGTLEQDRLADIANFYTDPDINHALAFLKKYNVRYIILGQLEQGFFPGPGLDKFAAQDGKLWRQVYPAPGADLQNETIIYEVIQP